MRNLYNFLVLSYKLLININNTDELCIILDDSASSVINTSILRKLCMIGIFFKITVVIYKHNQRLEFNQMVEVDDYLSNFTHSYKPFNITKFLNTIPLNSYKVIYSDFYINETEEQLIHSFNNISLISNSFSFSGKIKNTYLMRD
jgi:hypothetical protein